MPTTKKKTIRKATVKRVVNTTGSKDLDGVYLLKLTLYVILGSMWIKISNQHGLSLPIPVGFIIGLVFASHEHFRIDRKIEYATLLVAMLVGYFAPYGLYISW
jgi:hypothetical protein